MEQIKDQDEMNKALAASGDYLVLVVFFSPRCGFCKRLMPYIESLCPQMPDIQFKKIDVITSIVLVDNYGISGVPDIFFFKHGIQIDRLTGPNNEMLLHRLTDLRNQK